MPTATLAGRVVGGRGGRTSPRESRGRSSRGSFRCCGRPVPGHHRLDHGGDVVDRGGGKDSVAEVEDVSSDRGATLQHLGGGGDDRVWISEEDRRVEI